MPKISDLVKTDELGRVIGDVKLTREGMGRLWFFMPMYLATDGYTKHDMLYYGLDSNMTSSHVFEKVDTPDWKLWTPPEETVEITENDLRTAYANVTEHSFTADEIWRELLRIAKEKK